MVDDGSLTWKYSSISNAASVCAGTTTSGLHSKGHLHQPSPYKPVSHGLGTPGGTQRPPGLGALVAAVHGLEAGQAHGDGHLAGADD